MENFATLLAGHEALVKNCQHLGFQKPTAIQAEVLPEALAGQDILAQAPTGTGKTLAFALPLLMELAPSGGTMQGLVLVPTRELAQQITQAIEALKPGTGLDVISVYGGQAIRRQRQQLKTPRAIVVGTPGRVLDLLKKGLLPPKHLKKLILDEADELLDMGFMEELQAIRRFLPKKRQTLLFSATWPHLMQKLAATFLKEPQHIKTTEGAVTANNLLHFFTLTQEEEKYTTLIRFIAVERPRLALIFCRTKQRVDALGRLLMEAGYAAEALHGDLSQSKRQLLLQQFREEKITLLVATDVAARGLDIPEVSHVINYDIPEQAESYVHRVGRTARAGASGCALTFVGPGDQPQLTAIEQFSHICLTPLKPKSEREAFNGEMQRIIHEAESLAQKTSDHNRYQAAVKQLTAKFSAEDLAYLLLKSQEKALDTRLIRLSRISKPKKFRKPYQARKKGKHRRRRRH